jgi:hypothetical protein
LERARGLPPGNAKAAYAELAPLQDKLTGQPEFDYLLGVAALDSGRNDEAIIAFECVLALVPNHAGAQMDLARAYYASGSYDLAEAAFQKLEQAKPPTPVQQVIGRYLEAIRGRNQQTTAGWIGFGELGIGYDSNITGVPTDLAAAQQAFNISGITATELGQDRCCVRRRRRRAVLHPARPRLQHLRRWRERSSASQRIGFNSVSGGCARRRAQQRRQPVARDGLVFHVQPGRCGARRSQATSDGAWVASRSTVTRWSPEPGKWRSGERGEVPHQRDRGFDQVYLQATWLKSFERSGSRCSTSRRS